MRRRTLLQLPLALAPVVAAAGPALAAPRAATGDVHLVTAAWDRTYLSHAIRHGDGSWDRFNPLEVGTRVTEVLASTVSDGELHLLHQGFLSNMPPAATTVLRTRHRDGSWSSHPLNTTTLPGDHGIAVVNGELHIVKTGGSGMYHYVRYRDGSWSMPMEFPKLGTGASLANVGGVLHLMSSSGNMNTVLHLMTWQNGTWSAPVETAVLPHPGGDVTRLGIAAVGADLHAVVRTPEERLLLHSIRRPDGSWTAWGDVGREAGVQGVPDAISVTRSGNTLHLAVTTDRGLFHTIRFADRTWQRFADVSGAAGPVTAQALTIAGE